MVERIVDVSTDIEDRFDDMAKLMGLRWDILHKNYYKKSLKVFSGF